MKEWGEKMGKNQYDPIDQLQTMTHQKKKKIERKKNDGARPKDSNAWEMIFIAISMIFDDYWLQNPFFTFQSIPPIFPRNLKVFDDIEWFWRFWESGS